VLEDAPERFGQKKDNTCTHPSRVCCFLFVDEVGANSNTSEKQDIHIGGEKLVVTKET
jgi:hypothetical protein